MVLNNNIEELLEKYENGETSLKEEQQLKNYFSQETVAPHLEMYKPMFAYFLVNEKEQFTKDVPLKTKNYFEYSWISVAAVVVLFLGFYFINPFASPNQDELGTFSESEKELAYNEVTSALQLISSSFNKGMKQMNYLNNMELGVSKVNYLNELDNTTSQIFKSK